MTIENAINIYTDGSSFSHPRTGGIGIRLVIINSQGQQEIHDVKHSGYAGATNNQMELYACIKGLEEAQKHPAFSSVNRIVIHTDSQYVINNRKTAFYSWSKNQWRNKYGRPVANAGLWRELLKIVKYSRKYVDFYWVAGSVRNPHHKVAHKLAKQSAKNVIHPPLNVIKVRKKLSPMHIDPGCVRMENQRISIRIINDKYLNLQRCYQYEYEVISKKSPYYQRADIIFSDIMLDGGHCYSVRFNDNQNYPMINKMFKELPKLRK
jgi:ribonuclease HI